MALFLTRDEHAANPPATWQVTKVGDRRWSLRTADGATLDTYDRKRDAENGRHAGFYVKLYADEAQWFARQAQR